MTNEELSFKTKTSLAAALKKTMETKELSKITVSELSAKCNVNRKTFYYHFSDVYDLLKWLLESEAIEVVKQFDLTVDYQNAILFVMDYVEKNEYLISCAYDAMGREELKRFFYADFYEIILSILDGAEKEYGRVLSSEYKKFLTNFYIEALAGMLIDWVKHRMERNREQTIKYVFDTIKLSLIGIICEGNP